MNKLYINYEYYTLSPLYMYTKSIVLMIIINVIKYRIKNNYVYMYL